jgi:hypothetical protein
MELSQVIVSIENLPQWQHAEKIRFFAWYLHSHRAREHFSPADILACYDQIHLDKPANIHQSLAQMLSKRPRDLLKGTDGYRLEKRIRDNFEAKYGRRQSAISIDKLLLELPNKIPNIGEREFLDEALRCFQAGAFRAAVVMCWNLAFDHLCNFILQHHLSSFNQQWPIRFKKHHEQAKIPAVSKRDDFAEFKEFDVIDICRSAGFLSADVCKVLREKLDKRNSAAHPSGVVISQLQAEGFIDDLVRNVVLKLV